MKKIALASLLILPVISLSAVTVSAHENETESGRRFQYSRWSKARSLWRQKGGVLGIKDWKITDKNCVAVQNRIAKKAESLAKAQTEKQEKYERIVARLESVIAKANDQGLDTTKLQEDVEILNEKVQLYAVQAALLNSKLAEATDVDCDSDEGPDQLQVILQEARTQLKAVREASKDVHRFIRETVISDLRELKSQIVDTSNEEESTESE
ncbi:hypothetical protein KC959_00445 [Candidatus Saccharibacteria bacterium]|nr:hypothetical protein [Candidatus Saccharibacteria bacterium]